MANYDTTRWVISGDDTSLSFKVSRNGSSAGFDSSPSVLNVQSTTISLRGEKISGIGVWGYVNEKDKTLSLFESMVKIESHTEISQTQGYYEGLYLPTATTSVLYNGQQNLFGILTAANEKVISVLVQCLLVLCNNTGSVSVKINYSAPEEQELVIAGCLQNYINSFPEKVKSSITWSW